MWDVKTTVTLLSTGADGGISKSRNKANYRKQPYWALYTHFGKCERRDTMELTQALAI